MDENGSQEKFNDLLKHYGTEDENEVAILMAIPTQE